ncbi:hypothetical protein C0J29_30555 (plasmid) [Mycobacterium paragordonae]|uniref:Discoidin domain-containing protein n=1 Tax=Mycobacterium paragordonae TaxID=1389713 RepID=A0ABQ1CFC2_9MYCO|nr:hypothetical protein [Mycobacterium paragordonae]AYE99314.1 hypothetical protein C0J29_30555 [Mycobacterium paragordonae]PJE25175.1 MAG: hypothetical protein CK431_02185 [Mycobacterium sp.]GFG82930.1 hypothetical protein MPRG_62060 [Mycobacterium paragordonae]
MSGTANDPEQLWCHTQEWINDKDGPLVGPEGGCELDALPGKLDDLHALSEDPDDLDAPPGELDGPDLPDPHPQAGEPGGDAEGQVHEHHADGHEGASTAADCAQPDSSDEQGTQAGHVDTGEHDEDNPPPDAVALDPAAAAAGEEPGAESPRYNKAIAHAFAAATLVTTLVVSGVLLAMRHSPHTDDQDHPTRPSTHISVVAAPTTSTGPSTGGQDAPIPYTATAVGCLAGSSAAQSVAGTDPTQAWVCVHGATVGQHLVLNLGRTMVITGVSLTPGWVGTDASGADQWLQHLVVKRVQWSFNDSPPTVIPQETHGVHGDAPQALPGRGVLASRIIVLIQETGRAATDPAPSSAPNPNPGGGGLFGDILGPTPSPAEPAPTTTAVLPGLPADPSRTDPADHTFAVSSVKIFGHPPQ